MRAESYLCQVLKGIRQYNFRKLAGSRAEDFADFAYCPGCGDIWALIRFNDDNGYAEQCPRPDCRQMRIRFTLENFGNLNEIDLDKFFEGVERKVEEACVDSPSPEFLRTAEKWKIFTSEMKYMDFFNTLGLQSEIKDVRRRFEELKKYLGI